MPEGETPESGSGRPDLSHLFAAVTNLTETVDQLRQLLNQRWPEIAGPSGIVESLSERYDELARAVEDLQQRAEAVTAETEDLSRQQTMFSRELLELERKLDEQNRRIEDSLSGPRRIDILEERLGELNYSAEQTTEAVAPASEADAASAPGASRLDPADLANRVQRLESNEAVLLRVIELVVERAWILARRERPHDETPD